MTTSSPTSISLVTVDGFPGESELQQDGKVDTNVFVDVAAERDLYRRVLELGSQQELRPFVRDALVLLCEAAGAHQGYLELSSPDRDTSRWHAAHGFSDSQVESIRAEISSGIIAEAIATGQIVVTQSALQDQRFEARESVRGGQIQAVLCAPIGEDPVLGVLYLQRRLEPGAFDAATVEIVETISRHLAPYADRLMERAKRVRAEDPTREPRSRLRNDERLIGRSDAIAAVLRDVCLAAPLDVGVLLTGPSGTGKTEVARLIHDNSPRSGRPFVELNCNAIPESLVEAELFGALPGSHSMADRKIEGKVAVAEGGTLFLDEIGDLPASAQGKLLQLLQSRAYYPLGSSRPLQADIRIIAATNADLEAAVAEGRFREDLYYRLNVLPMKMPSLAERTEDIEPLAVHFCEAACARHGLPRLNLSRQLLRALETAEWGGNVRQLANAIEAAAIRTAGSGGLQIERSLVFPQAESGQTEKAVGPPTFQEATRRFQAQLLRDTFEETGWNILEASRRLELTRSHVYTLIKAFGIERKR